MALGSSWLRVNQETEEAIELFRRTRLPEGISVEDLAIDSAISLSIRCGASERIPVSRDLTSATINPHRFAAFAWALIGHTSSAPWWSCDVAALDYIWIRSSGEVANSGMSRR